MISQERNSWRLIKNYDRGKYCFLIRVNEWSVELQKHEFISLYHLIDTLDKEFKAIKDNLMDEELITLEIEKTPWYGELEGNKKNWSLRLILESNDNSRSFEMYWPIQIAENLLFETRKMWESMH